MCDRRGLLLAEPFSVSVSASNVVVRISPGPAEAIWVWYGKKGYVHCRRQCVEARSADLYIARSTEIFFQGHFFFSCLDGVS